MKAQAKPINSIDPKAKKGVLVYLVISIAVLILMMIFGLLMLLNQGKIIHISPNIFYEFLTIHGTGMIGIAAFAATAIMWYFLGQYVKLKARVLFANLFFFVLGVVLVLVGIFGFKFGGAWTFLYPLPAISAGMWGKIGATLYLSGMIVIGVGFLLIYLECARAIIARYGSLGNALGWQQIFRGDKNYGPPGTVVASTMSIISNTTGLVIGAAILMMEIINLYYPNFPINMLLAKNMIYAFGHIFANVVIYMAVIAVYEVLPRYTNRPWKSNKVFLIAWNFSTLFTIIIYPHHLLMDFAMPKWALIAGQAISYANGFPVLVVTAYGALMLVYRSGIKWDMASGLLFFSMFGWCAGVVPAIIDATIVVNHVMHNTKWVPGHFHMYMGMGAVAMIIGFMYYFAKTEGTQKDSKVDWFSFLIYGLFFLGLAGSFLYSGFVSAPRRWAEHMPEWVGADQVGALCASFIILATIIFTIRFVTNVSKGSHTNA